MKLIGVPKGGRDNIVIAETDPDEYWRIEGDFVVIFRNDEPATRAYRIPSHVQSIIAGE